VLHRELHSCRDSASTIKKSFQRLKEDTQKNVAEALKCYEKTEFLRFTQQTFAGSLSVSQTLSQFQEQESILQKEVSLLMTSLCEREDETRQQLKHFSTLESVERDAVQVTAAKLMAAEQTPLLEAAAADASARLERAKSEREILSLRKKRLSDELHQLQIQVHAQQRLVDDLAIVHAQERAPLFAAVQEAESLASEAADWRVLENRLRGELERLEAERATLMATRPSNNNNNNSVTGVVPVESKRKIAPLPQAAVPAVSRPLKRDKPENNEDVFFW
jgi:chromosome segregation ATPase